MVAPLPAESRLDTEIVIIGAGVVGLAIARSLALHRRTGAGILLLERNAAFGAETSSRSSEVIHAGLYYPPGSLKARHCLRGRELLYDYCFRHSIPCQCIGKLVVARGDEYEALQALYDNALASGVAERDLCRLDGAGVKNLEPALCADQGLWSLQSGIVDSHALMQRLLDEAQSLGVTWAPMTRVEHVNAEADHRFVLRLASGSRGEPVRVQCRALINAAGLGAVNLARRIHGLKEESVPVVRYVKGQYFSWNGASPFSRLVYPLPPAHGKGLGIHATLDLAGRLRFGPDTVEVQAPDYRVDESRRPAFVEAIQRYFPAVDGNRLMPDYAGVRPRAVRHGDTAVSDFVIRDESERGLPGLVQLFGIESPGLTAALSIAESVAGTIADPPRRYAYRLR